MEYALELNRLIELQWKVLSAEPSVTLRSRCPRKDDL